MKKKRRYRTAFQRLFAASPRSIPESKRAFEEDAYPSVVARRTEIIRAAEKHFRERMRVKRKEKKERSKKKKRPPF